jgi:hypothetical protein
MAILDFGKSLAKPQAVKTSVSEAAMRKVDKMFDNAAKPKINVSKTPAKPMAVKVDKRSPTGSRNRKPDRGGRRETTQAQRGEVLKKHFKNILTGRASRALQGNK